jgi:hypothetical protein
VCPQIDSGSRHQILKFFCGSSSGVEHNLAKVGVGGPNPLFRSSRYQAARWFLAAFFCCFCGKFYYTKHDDYMFSLSNAFTVLGVQLKNERGVLM